MATAGEEQPLLSEPAQDVEANNKHIGPILDFKDGDSDNPREWAPRFKQAIVLLLAFMAFVVTFTCIGVVPIAVNIIDELEGKHANPATSALLVTIWELGEAAGPLLIAPLSEVFGRYPVMNACNILFIIATLLSAASRSTALLITARWLTGFAVASNVLNPSIIGDIFESDQRGSAMSLVSVAPLIGAAIGPAIAGAIAQTLGWRQVLLMAAGLAVIAELLFLFCFRETYKPAILARRRQYQQGYPQQEQTQRDATTVAHSRRKTMNKILHALTRPFAVLFGSKVLMAISFQASISFSYFYVTSISLPQILQGSYGFTPAETGATFIFFSLGSLLAVLLCNFTLDRIYISLNARRTQSSSSSSPSTSTPASTPNLPENRLPLSILGAVLLPSSILLYGLSASYHLPAAVILASVSFLDFTLLVNIIPTQAYIVDATGDFSASAMTGVIVCRCLMGTFLPLGSGILNERIGFAKGFGVLAGLAAAVAVVPVAVFYRGERWRRGSLYTRGDGVR